LYGRSLVNRRAQVIVPALRSKNISVFAVMSAEKLLAYQVMDGAGNRTRMAQFMTVLFAKLEENNISNAYIIMDNASFHHCREIIDMTNLNNHEIVFLPPYSPFFNPIENLFSQWKHIVRSANSQNEVDLVNAINNYENLCSYENCQSYYRHMTSNVVRFLAGEPIIND
jgi:transposase